VRLLLIRHGESVAAVDGIKAGRDGCPGLTPRGVEQARDLGRRLDIRPDVLVSSSVLRARQTADELIAALRPGRVEIDDDLCEQHLGEGDGLPTAEFYARYGRFDPSAEPTRLLSPGGETWHSFVGRVHTVLTTWPERYADQTVVAVTHAGFLVGMFLSAFGVPRPGTGARIEFDFASVTEWEFSGHWRLVCLNLT
jgi:probable phosphoglycerate mutase